MAMHANLTLKDIEAAAMRIKPQAVITPLVECDALNVRTEARIFLKAECLQRTGSFKFRGAYNKVSQLGDDALRAGVVACSSGNHAQGLARAAQIAGTQATIVMPADAPIIKIKKTRHYGAHIVIYDRYRESREEIAMGIARDTGALFVPPYDDFDIMAGQGTIGLEILQQAPVTPDLILIACSGGGLTAGVASAVRSLADDITIMTVEPEHHDDHARSFKQGQRVRNTEAPTSICDALLAPEPGELTWAVNERLVAGGLTVTDQQVKAAIRFAFQELKLVVEPGGAAALAAVLGNNDLKGKNVVAILSGGNIDPSLFSSLLSVDTAPL